LPQRGVHDIKPGFLVKIKARGILKPPHIVHMGGFKNHKNKDIEQKDGYVKASKNHQKNSNRKYYLDSTIVKYSYFTY